MAHGQAGSVYIEYIEYKQWDLAFGTIIYAYTVVDDLTCPVDIYIVFIN